MKALDYNKILRSLHAPWGAIFDPMKATSDLARDFVEESAAISVNFQLSRRAASQLPLAAEWSAISGEHQRPLENGATKLMNSALGKLRDGKNNEGLFLCQWHAAKDLDQGN